MSTQVANRADQRSISRLYDDPFRSIETRMNQLFRNMFEDPSGDSAIGNYPVDVHEDDDRITIEAEMPGFKTDEIDVNLENGVLTLKAEREVKEREGKGKKHLSERRYTRVQRSFSLPRTVDGSDVEAKYQDGLLTLTLNKTEESKPRRIKVK